MHLTYPPQLPVSGRRTEIAAAIRDHQVVVVAGETGSGKTTQLPKICLELGRGAGGRDGKLIGHTQPRRIAARSVAERIAEELGSELGDLVGYQVRFTDRTSPHSRVKVMTDGILLAELQGDRDLQRYDTLIIDEAHERSLNVDFILGYLSRLLPRRPDLKVIITSATIDPERFAGHFADAAGRPAPIIEVSGRTYPVEVRYRPLVEESYADEEGEVVTRDQTEAILAAVDELSSETRGDILVFLPGEREIRDTADALAGRAQGPRGFDVVPLFSRLSSAEQHRVFEAHTRQRVVLATNVAETSLTVPGITAVIDTGLARISRYSLRTKVQRLPIEPISQASAQQRSGRCGRTEAGVAIRLYAEADFESRPEFTEPEILRTSLASVILQMASLRLGEVARFPFVDPPDQRNVRNGTLLLEELGALRRGKLTGTGRKLARLPIDPQLGRMLLEADRRGCLAEVLVIAAALSIQDPRERPVDQREQADQAHARFADDRSDFVAWLNLWRHLRAQQQELGSSAFRRMCRREHLNYLRIREWQDFAGQLRQVAKQIGLRPGKLHDTAPYDTVHQALLAGLLSHVGLREEVAADGERTRGRGRRPMPEYLGARGTRFAIFPGSGLSRSRPELVVAAELVETSRLWGRQVAAIEPEWAEELGSHLVKRSYAEPHWSAKRAAAMARERVTLYGVPLVADRAVTLATRDPALARELFIRHALVQGEWRTQHRFYETNRRLLAEAEELENRARRRGLVVDEETLVDFYETRIPAEVVSGAHFDTWWKQERRRDPDLLTFDPAMLVRADAEAITEQDFPQVWREGSAELPVAYRFEPGADRDGVRIDVPLDTLNVLDTAALTWTVPGMRTELVTALIRSLPKQLRVNFVPAPDFAREFLAAVPPGEERLLDALGRHLRAVTGVNVPADAWDLAKVPEHLLPTFRVVDDGGGEVAAGKDLDSLIRSLSAEAADAVDEAAGAAGLHATGQVTWTFGTLTPRFARAKAGREVHGYRALVDEGGTVGLRVAASESEQEARHRLGVRRLVALAVGTASAALLDELENRARLGLAGTPYPNVRALLEDCEWAALGELVDDAPQVWDEESFAALVGRAREELTPRTRQLLAAVLAALDAWRAVDRDLHGRVDLSRLPSMNDLRGQLDALVRPGFIGEAGPALVHYPRYLAAMRARLEKLPGDVNGDRVRMRQVAVLHDAWASRAAALPPGRPLDANLRRVRWLLEEFRVSLWAQPLGTAEPVSDARIRKVLER